MKCPICDTRKPRRHCPGIHGEICSICCGNEREVSITCPFDCPYLMEARRHEKPHELNPDELPNRNVQVTEQFLNEHEALLVFLGSRLLEASLATAGAVDSDVRDALQSLIRTYRTLQSGLYYETRPTNLLAAGIHDACNKPSKVCAKSSPGRMPCLCATSKSSGRSCSWSAWSCTKIMDARAAVRSSIICTPTFRKPSEAPRPHRR